MSGLDHTVKFDTSRPKREPRPISKKRAAGEATKDPKVPQQRLPPKPEGKDGRRNKSVQPSLAPLDDDADNQGFAEWLRSGDGVDMMRLFVLANSVLVLVTMALPHMQQTFDIIRELIFGDDE